MSDPETSRALVTRLEVEVAASEAEIAQLKAQKGPSALAAERGGPGSAGARQELRRTNTDILREELSRDDLEAALEAARGELLAVEAADRRRRDVALADEVEAVAGELREASVAVDGALAALAEVFGRRAEVAQRLFRLAPTLRRDAELRVVGTGSATRAARRLGLGDHLRLQWSGERHHEAPLAACFPVPEVEELVARLRGAGSPAADREEAA